MKIKKIVLSFSLLLLYVFIFYNFFLIKYFNISIFALDPQIKTTSLVDHHIYDNKWISYTDKIQNYTTMIPKNWAIIKSKTTGGAQNESITIFRSPKENSEDKFQENIVISIKKMNKYGNDNNSFQIQSIIDKLANNNKDFKLENISNIVVGQNQTGKSIEYSFNNFGLNFRTEQVFSLVNNKIYIFSLLAEQNTFEKYIPILKFMLENFRILN